MLVKIEPLKESGKEQVVISVYNTDVKEPYFYPMCLTHVDNLYGERDVYNALFRGETVMAEMTIKQVEP